MKKCHITDIENIKIGQIEDREAVTGVTVIYSENGMTASADIRGGAPGTRETDLLRPENLVDKVHGVFLAGGSAYGLDVATGIMNYLEEIDIGFDTGVCKVPIVTGAILFDLNIGNPKIRPDANMGYQATKKASNTPIKEGNFGCGMGATLGKFMGDSYTMKSGIGSSSFKLGDLIVGSIVAVNPFGEVFDPNTGTTIAGAYDRKSQKLQSLEKAFSSIYSDPFSTNTTIGTIITNADISKANAKKISEMAHSGISRTIRPSHTMVDGDSLFTLATNEVEADINLIGHMASKSVENAILQGVKTAESICNYPSYKDIW
ncbi:P1 family peptidase [Natranaerobius trueperi]|uniref:Peptidase n=1 Tax=Natranaerobius trueperi TaxID=759412 RepID=A0A226C100_9FIRM|nr:P1 family peptidase [Natranaerobius trueperi]OWZ84841.1 peptidase [Natranaerobius trueperi]